jgi:hypothetical protein
MLLPALLEHELPRLGQSMTRAERGTIATAVLAALVLAAFSVARPGPPVGTTWKSAALAPVDQVLREDPHARVLAGYDLADWVLFETPRARGRLAYDGRWEILSRSQFLQVMGYLGRSSPGWQHFGAGYRLVVLNPENAGGLVRWYQHQAGVATLFKGPRTIVFDLKSAAGSPR